VGNVSDLGAEDLARLHSYMRRLGLAHETPPVLKWLAGGQSNPTYRVDTDVGSYVLRKKPAGQLQASAHAIDREYRIMKALAGTDVPVPKMLDYCEDESIIGTPFYLMPFLQGRVYMDQSLPDMSAKERRSVYMEMNKVLAALHRLDPVALGLQDYGRQGNYFARQIGRWSKQYLADPHERITEIEKLIEWLPERIPEGDESRIVHGDYRLDNLMLDASQPRVIAVLDWELSTLGHPLADFSYHCMSWHIPPALWRGIAGLDLKQLGIPDESEYIESYVQATGLIQAREHWDFYLAYNFFRIAAILHGIGQRARQGTASSPDALEMAAKAQPLAALGWHFAQRYQAGRQ